MTNLTPEEYESLRKVAETCCAFKNHVVMKQEAGEPLDLDEEGMYTLCTSFMFLYRKFVKPADKRKH